MSIITGLINQRTVFFVHQDVNALAGGGGGVSGLEI